MAGSPTTIELLSLDRSIIGAAASLSALANEASSRLGQATPSPELVAIASTPESTFILAGRALDVP
jgi:hypothetical protein